MEKELAIMQDNIVMTTIEFGANSSNVEEAQKLLIKSDVGRIMAARKVITNPGSKTAGIDGITLSKEDLGTVIKQLKNIRGYQCKPVKRVYIPKNDGVNKRPLGIPCSIDRAWQALFNQALAPVIATLNCPRSYGYIKYRGCRDGVTYLKTCLNKRKKGINESAEFVIDADIKSFFDRIDHNWLIANTPLPYKHFLRSWLKAGAIDYGRLIDSDSGTPQGGIISPTLANLALAGLESHIKNTLPTKLRTNDRYIIRDGRLGKFRRLKRKINVVRYADDFVVTCRNRYEAKILLESINKFLKIRGLELNMKKTKVISVYEGFDFLGFTFKHFRNRGLLVYPSRNSIGRLKEKLRMVFNNPKYITTSLLIMKLNEVLKGWATYYRISTSTKSFTKIGHYVWHRYMKWLKSKYPKTGIRTLYNEHFSKVKTRTGNTILLPSSKSLDKRLDTTVNVTNIAGLRVVNLQKSSLQVDKNSYALCDKEYFDKLRIERASLYMDYQRLHIKLLKKQKGRCSICNEVIETEDVIEVDHIIKLKDGGEHKFSNLRLLHWECHRHKVHGKKNDNLRS